MRDSGIGAALLAAVLAEAGKLHANDRAMTFYQRAGFQHDQRWLRWKPE